ATRRATRWATRRATRRATRGAGHTTTAVVRVGMTTPVTPATPDTATDGSGTHGAHLQPSRPLRSHSGRPQPPSGCRRSCPGTPFAARLGAAPVAHRLRVHRPGDVV